MTWNPRSLDNEWPYDVLATDFRLDPATTALLIVDMQVGQMTIAADSPLATGYPHILRDWISRMDETVLPNTLLLIDFFRAQNLKIVYTRNGNVTTTHDEMTARLKPVAPPVDSSSYHASPAYQIDARLAPRPRDLVVDKLTSGAFTASFLDHALRNMGVRSLVITGVLTDACVFGTARAAAELGYNSLICEDACATLTQRAHDEALLMHARIFGRVERTEDVVAELGDSADGSSS